MKRKWCHQRKCTLKKLLPCRNTSVIPEQPGQLPPKKDDQDLLVLYILYIYFPNNTKVIDAVLFWKMWFSWHYLENWIKRFNKATNVKNMNICESKYIKKKQVTERLPEEIDSGTWFLLCSQDYNPLWDSTQSLGIIGNIGKKKYCQVKKRNLCISLIKSSITIFSN